MKNKFNILYVIFSILTLNYGLYLVLKLDWSFLDIKILAMVVTILSAFTIVLYFVLLHKKNHTKSVYISCGAEDKDKLSHIIRMMPKKVKVEDTLTLEPGEKLQSSLTKKINKSSFCLLMISHKITKLQRIEYGTMKSLGKECIPIIVSENECDMKHFKNVVPIFLKDDKLKDKLFDLLVKYSLLV